MKPFNVLHILILSLLLWEAKGIRRLGNNSFLSPSSRQLKIHDRVLPQNALDNGGKGSGDSAGGETSPRCKSGFCKGESRNFISTISSSMLEKNGENEQTTPTMKGKSNVHLAGSKTDNISKASTTKDEKEAKAATATSRQYPDLLDIAGMDYSPAKRKPPIHN